MQYLPILILVLFSGSCFADPGNSGVSFWLTKANKSVLLQKQNVPLTFGTEANQNPFIVVDSSKTYQQIDGFGYTLTGSSAWLISQMGAGEKSALLKELFGSGDGSIGVSYLRLSIGASDLSTAVYTYDDMQAGTDEGLAQFGLGIDKTTLVPLLQQIVKINPAIKIIATPWSAPAWMKDNNSLIGGTLQGKYYQAYADYFVKYIQAMKASGITIDAITPQNEPLNGHNNPSMVLSAPQELALVKNNLGPAFRKAGLKTKIIVWDHNCDNAAYPLAILNDKEAKEYTAGTAFHLYAGDISALSKVHDAFPDRNIYFTEQYSDAKGDFGGDLKWHLRNLVIGATRNWSRNVLEWNLANDPNYGPHTQGGCSTCKGALTISGSSVQRNVSYYVIAHASKFVPAGSVRISSNVYGNINNVAFLRPDGRKVLIAENDGNAPQTFNLKYNGQWAAITLDAGDVGTFMW